MRYRVCREGLSYPIGASLARVRMAGGRSRLAPAEAATLELRRPAVGDIVDDVPEESIGWLVAEGYLEPVAPPRGRS
ncbi:MAG TPA: hypothetical protein VNI83_04620 [Vicinamibacterales bacterium]|nr:hypothetical protein [Vicinamibacterales bacterium]